MNVNLPDCPQLLELDEGLADLSDSECGQGFLSLLCPRVRTGSRHTWLQLEAEWGGLGL